MEVPLDESLRGEMTRWEAAGLRRTLGTGERSERVDFASNDYLGLTRHPRIIESAQQALADHGVGGRASRLLGGGCILHEEAEEKCAEWLRAETALLFPSGYQANLGVIGALAGRGDAVFSDRKNHASLVDAARLSRARVYVHNHLDLQELECQLARAGSAARRLVVTEGVFSMDGDAPDLVRLNELCSTFDAWLIIDEAHSVGILGPQGSGVWEECAVEGENRLAARIVCAGKALGVSGAFVVGSDELRQHLIQRARSFLFTTAPSPAIAGALIAAIDACKDAEAERRAVCTKAKELAHRLDLTEPRGAIVPWIIGDAGKAIELSERLFDSGFEARAVRPPTVPDGASGLRLVVHCYNSEDEVDALARALSNTNVHVRTARQNVAEDIDRALFVAGTDTGIGKTVVSSLLLTAARRHGPAAYWKPVQTGEDSDSLSVRTLVNATNAEVLPPAWELPLPASPHAAAEDAGIILQSERLEEGLQGLLRTLIDTRLIVELAGGLLVPYHLDPVRMQADWLERAHAPLVLVARSELGTLNHTLLSLEALRARHLEPRALFLVGEPHASNRQTLDRIAHVPYIFEVPPFTPLDQSALEAWCQDHDLEALFRP
ncbi:MAG: dethiobiotin synthase [Planctomycetes bacterium]|jgi:8-amino-7-oxononanoate synthase|nr:dethiobiotin synthase [Planctomycetota bacterium]